MPRPADGYKNTAGQPVPGTTTIAKRYANSSGLIYWAHQEGLKGNPDLYAKAADIGTAVHKMCELDLRGASEAEINRAPGEVLSSHDDINMAWAAFRQFQAWRKEHNVRAIAFEESLVSEALQYGGTFDIIAMVDGQRSLLDFKSCKDAKKAATAYLDQRIAMSAHGNLWHEKHPTERIEAYHLINLPKDGGKFAVHSFADLSDEWEMFTLQLDCWKIENGKQKKRSKKAKAVAAPAPALDPPKPEEKPAPAPIEVKPAPAKPKRTRKPKAPPPVQLVLPEIIPAEPVQLDMLDYIADRKRCPMLADFMMRHKKSRSPWARP